MITRKRVRAEKAAKQFRTRTRDVIETALVGDGDGNVEVTGRAGWVWVRLNGSSDDVTQALNRSSVALVEGGAVDLRRVRRYAASYYEIVGASNAVVYDTLTSGASGTDFVKAHASQHERRDGGDGGSDPLDVYARMLVPLRARAQETPDLTLHVEAGYNPLTGNYVAEQDSDAFAPPATGGGGFAQLRWDLLYLDNADTLQILEGTAAAAASPTKPTIPENSVPLAYVYLSSALTAIEETRVYDARFVPGARVETFSGAAEDVTYDNGASGLTAMNTQAAIDELAASVGAGSDATAIHGNVAGEISALTEKTTPVSADLIVVEDSADSNNKKKVQVGNLPGAGGTAYGQVVDYPDAFSGDVINGASTTPFADVAAFDTKEVLNSRILHLVTRGASKDQRVRITLATTKSAAFDVRICLAVNGSYWSAGGGDYYAEVRLSTSGDAQLAIARIIPTASTGGTPYGYALALRVGGSSIASVDANVEPKMMYGSAMTLRFVRDGSNNILFYFGVGTAPMALMALLDGGLVLYTQAVSGTLARIEIAQHSPSGPGSTAQIETFVDYVASV